MYQTLSTTVGDVLKRRTPTKGKCVVGSKNSSRIKMSSRTSESPCKDFIPGHLFWRHGGGRGGKSHGHLKPSERESRLIDAPRELAISKQHLLPKQGKHVRNQTSRPQHTRKSPVALNTNVGLGGQYKKSGHGKRPLTCLSRHRFSREELIFSFGWLAPTLQHRALDGFLLSVTARYFKA